ncbi:MAG: hypothetical protein AAF614_26790 [Chloroflexota bacterium]
MTKQYEAYLVRLQRDEGQRHWRVTLINIHSGQQIHFRKEEALLAYLQRTLTENPEHLIKQLPRERDQAETNH